MADTASRSRARAWVFTINNPGPADGDLQEILEGCGDVKYAIWSLEEGEENHTPHYQGYVRFGQPKRFHFMQTLFPRARLATAKGNDEQNETYCSKNPLEGPFVIGEPKRPGKRSDWASIKEMCKKRLPDDQIAEEFPGHFARNYQGISRLKSVFQAPREGKPSIYVIYGKPGVGKSYYVRNSLFDNNRIYNKPPNTEWWDMYDGEESVIMDDFKGGVRFTSLKVWLDEYDFICQVKGGHVKPRFKELAITTNYMPKTWYDFTKHPWEALERRVTHWIHFYAFKKLRVFDSYSDFQEHVEQVESS